jgi:rhodanese-related sulfurtransferase
MFRFFGRNRGMVQVTPADVQQQFTQGETLYLLDVREPAEYVEARVTGSTLIPLGQLAGRVGELPRDQPIVTICRSGNRSGVAVQLLQRAGFTDVRNLAGGIIVWSRNGLPLERGR